MKVERRSITCMRYMPTLRVPVFGSFVMTAGSVMNGAGSPGQQRWIGSRPRSTSAPSRKTSWHGAFETVFGQRVGDRLQLEETLDLLAKPLRRLHVEDVAELGGRVVERLDAEREAHAPLGAELVDEERMLRALRVLEQKRGPAGLDDAIDDLGDLEVGVDLGRDAP